MITWKIFNHRTKFIFAAFFFFFLFFFFFYCRTHYRPNPSVLERGFFKQPFKFNPYFICNLRLHLANVFQPVWPEFKWLLLFLEQSVPCDGKKFIKKISWYYVWSVKIKVSKYLESQFFKWLSKCFSEAPFGEHLSHVGARQHDLLCESLEWLLLGVGFYWEMFLERQ